MFWKILLLVCSLMTGIVHGVDNLGFDKVSTLTELNRRNFDSHVYADNKPWAVVFFAPWCHWSQEVAPAWKETSKNLQGVVHMGYVNNPENKPLGRRFSLKYYPTIYMFYGNKSSPEEYEGNRTEAEMTDTFASLVNENGGEHTDDEIKVLENEIPSEYKEDIEEFSKEIEKRDNGMKMAKEIRQTNSYNNDSKSHLNVAVIFLSMCIINILSVVSI